MKFQAAGYTPRAISQPPPQPAYVPPAEKFQIQSIDPDIKSFAPFLRSRKTEDDRVSNTVITEFTFSNFRTRCKKKTTDFQKTEPPVILIKTKKL